MSTWLTSSGPGPTSRWAEAACLPIGSILTLAAPGRSATTDLACKAEHVVDLKSEFVLPEEVYAADQADAATVVERASGWNGASLT